MLDSLKSVQPGWVPLILAGVPVLYFLPSLVALLRGHRQLWALAVVNLVAGWNEVGWLGVMVWAMTGKRSASLGRSKPDPASPADDLPAIEIDPCPAHQHGARQAGDIGRLNEEL